MQSKVHIINLFAGPGAGKSTLASGIFHELKKQGVVCEYVTEYAKDAVYDLHHETLKNQFFVSAQQHHRIWRVANYHIKRNEDVIIITDSPFLQGVMYMDPKLENNGLLMNFLMAEHLQMQGFNNYSQQSFFLKRQKEYQSSGRNQTEEEAREIDERLLDFSYFYGIDMKEIDADINPKEFIEKYLRS